MLNAAIIICSTEFHDRHCFVSYKQLNTNCGSVINKQTQGCLPLAPMPKNKCHHFQCSDNASWLELLFPAPWRPELILIPRFKKPFWLLWTPLKLNWACSLVWVPYGAAGTDGNVLVGEEQKRITISKEGPPHPAICTDQLTLSSTPTSASHPHFLFTQPSALESNSQH